MHPRHHLILSTVAAVAAYPRLGRRVLVPWAASLLADLDHVPPYIARNGVASPATMWRFFRSDRGDEHQHLLHRWPVILVGLAMAPLTPFLGLVAAGLAFHRILDDLHGLLKTPWRRLHWRMSAQGRLHARLHRRDGHACRICGAMGQRLELHHLTPERTTRPGYPSALISVCVSCHQQLHSQAQEILILPR